MLSGLSSAAPPSGPRPPGTSLAAAWGEEDGPAPGLARLLAQPIRLRRGALLWQELRAVPLPELVIWGPVAFCVGAGLGCGPLAGATGWGTAAVMLVCAIAGFAATAMGRVRNIQALVVAGLAAMLLSALAGGVAAALFRAEAVRAPVVPEGLGARVVEGAVVSLDRSEGGSWRVVVAVRSIEGLAPAEVPARVRFSLRNEAGGASATVPRPGQLISCAVSLNPPPGPVVPGAYDFARTAWFRQLGGVGFALQACAVRDAPGAPGFAARLEQTRRQAATYLAEGHGGAGGFLAAVSTGDRSWLDPADVEALQASGLAHIVSVSGLHVSLVSGMVFLVVLKLLAAIPPLALRIDVRKPAAATAFAAALAYTIFTGAEAPAVRACVMTGVVLGAILLERKAFTRRGLALAALLILAVRPESAVEPGFQMSFLATLALVSLWESWSNTSHGLTGIVQDPRSWVLGTLAASTVAGLATAPVAAAVFHRVSPWGMISNLLAIPVEDFVVAPAALAATVLAPLGLDGPFWAIARWGLDVVLAIAYWVAGWPGAGAGVVPPGPVPPVLLVGAIVFACLARTWLRWLALVPALMGLAGWILAPRTELWIAPDGQAALAAPAGQLAKLCFLPGARFDGIRLIDEAGLDRRTARLLTPAPRTAGDTTCHLTGPDWSLSFEPEGNGRLRPVLVHAGAVLVPERTDLHQGALLQRTGQRTRLVVAPRSDAPWAVAPAGSSSAHIP